MSFVARIPKDVLIEQKYMGSYNITYSVHFEFSKEEWARIMGILCQSGQHNHLEIWQHNPWKIIFNPDIVDIIATFQVTNPKTKEDYKIEHVNLIYPDLWKFLVNGENVKSLNKLTDLLGDYALNWETSKQTKPLDESISAILFRVHVPFASTIYKSLTVGKNVLGFDGFYHGIIPVVSIWNCF